MNDFPCASLVFSCSDAESIVAKFKANGGWDVEPGEVQLLELFLADHPAEKHLSRRYVRALIHHNPVG